LKTLVLHINQDGSFFTVLQGNYSHLNNTELNTEQNLDLEKELFFLLYNEDGVVRVEQLDSPTKDWDYFITTGCY
jgi:hypothetical protein